MKKSPWTESSGTKNRQSSDSIAPESDDPLNPAIPKAPLIPHDIARMPNAALPVWTYRPPAERAVTEWPPLATAAIEIEFRDHVDAQPPPGVTPSTYQSAAMPPHSDPFGQPSLEPPPLKRAPVEAAANVPARTPAPLRENSPRPTAVEHEASSEIEPAPSRVWLIAIAAIIVAVLAGIALSYVLH